MKNLIINETVPFVHNGKKRHGIWPYKVNTVGVWNSDVPELTQVFTDAGEAEALCLCLKSSDLIILIAHLLTYKIGREFSSQVLMHHLKVTYTNLYIT